MGKSIAGKYKVLEVLGQGGFGTVYRVEITAGMVGEQLALKILPQELSSQPAFRNQFLNEIRVAMRVVDRYIAQIRDVGATEDGLLYYTMDLCQGITLAQLLKAEGKLPATRTLLIVLNVLRGLQTAHAEGIIHRDLKPANIMVQSQGGKDTVRILDFGIATAVQSGGERPKGFAGSPHYMPPEQFMGEALGFHTDLYSMGVILYECLSGERPYRGTSAQEVFKSLKTGTARPLDEAAPEVAELPGLSEVVMKAIEKNPERRYQSARALFDAVNGVLGHATSASAPIPPAKMQTRAAAPEQPVPDAQQAPGIPPAARALAGKIRRRKSVARGRRPGSHASAVALGTFVIAGTIVGVLFNRNLVDWWNSFNPSSSSAAIPSSQPKEAPRAPREAPIPKSSPVEAKTTPKDKPLDQQKAAARAELEGQVARLLDEARKASTAKDWATVVERSDTAIGFDQGNAEAHMLRGVAALKLLDLKTAEAALSRAHDLYEGANAGEKMPVELLTALAETRLSASPSDLGSSEALAREATKRSPRDPAPIALLARILEKQGKRSDAKKLLQAAEAGRIESKEISDLSRRIALEETGKLHEEAEALAARARESFLKGDAAQAAELASRSRDLDATEAGYWVGADASIELQQLQQARKLLVEARERGSQSDGKKPAGSPALEGRLELLRGLETLQQVDETPTAEMISVANAAFDSAREKLARAADSGTSSRIQRLATLALADAQARRGNSIGVDQALNFLGTGAEATPSIEVARIFTRLARTVRGKDDQAKGYKKAVTSVERLLKTDSIPTAIRAEASFLLGSSNLALGALEANDERFKAAIASFAAAEKSGLKTVELFEGWAQAYDKVGNLIRAAQLYRSAYEVSPSPQSCLRAVSSYLNANPQSPEARELLKQARSLFKGNAEVEKKCKEILD